MSTQQLHNEQLMITTLKALVEEWGAQYVTVGVPKSWEHDVQAGTLGKVKLAFETDNTLRIRVDCDTVCIRQDFPIQVAA